MNSLAQSQPAVDKIQARGSRSFSLSAECLFDIERELSEPLFFGVPIGSTLGDIYYSELFLGNISLRPIDIGLDVLRYAYHWLRRLPSIPYGLSSCANRFLLTWLNEKSHCRELVLPVVNALDPNRCTIIGKSPTMKTHLPPETGFLAFDHIPPIATKKWRSEYTSCARIWNKKLRTVIKRHGISLAIIPHLSDAMLVQSRRVVAFGEALDQLKPLVVLTEYDRNTLASCLVLAAKARGIPTMTMMHGVVNPPYGYTPLLADIALCWGEQHREQMIELGTEPKRLIITGCQRLTPSLISEPGAARAKLELPIDRTLVLLATDPILPEHKKKLARTFGEALAGKKEISAVVRLHPSEKIEEYAAEIAKFPTVRFLSNDAWTLDEALAAADIIVCHDSGLGNDALMKDKLTVILDVLPVPLGNGKQLITQAGCPCAKSANELAEIVERIAADASFRQLLRERAESYTKYFCFAFGEVAARNVANEIGTIVDARLRPLKDDWLVRSRAETDVGSTATQLIS